MSRRFEHCAGTSHIRPDVIQRPSYRRYDVSQTSEMEYEPHVLKQVTLWRQSSDVLLADFQTRLACMLSKIVQSASTQIINNDYVKAALDQQVDHVTPDEPSSPSDYRSTAHPTTRLLQARLLDGLNVKISGVSQ